MTKAKRFKDPGGVVHLSNISNLPWGLMQCEAGDLDPLILEYDFARRSVMFTSTRKTPTCLRCLFERDLDA